jgi:hypothetical protein
VPENRRSREGKQEVKRRKTGDEEERTGGKEA